MGTRTQLSPRVFMERAVQVMRESVAEPRRDGKASPWVGAVLVTSEGEVATASRGELRHGDHAEFTLLERKNRDRKLDGAMLFTTLEPCAPGARRHPKLSCAERIALARIQEVWVGIEDPDPTVDRKGIQYLQENGVTVHLFDRDLQEAIRETNADFLEQAEARASEASERPRGTALNALEGPIEAARLDDLDDDLLAEYRGALRLANGERETFHRRLLLQGLIARPKRTLLATGSGMLLFGKAPRTAMPQAGLLGTVHLPDGREETRDFEGPALRAPEEAIRWFQDKLPDPIDRSRTKRGKVNEVLHELLREGLINALVHRDYGIAGAKCQVIGEVDKIVVMSPGLPVEPITLEQLQAFDAPMLSRNPVLHFVFAKMKLAEERGLGLKSMRSRAQEAGLPLPTYAYVAPYLVLTLYRSASAVVADDRSEVLRQLNDSEREGWAWVVTQESFRTAEYEEALGVPNRTAKNHVKKFTELGLLLRLGAGRATRYEVVRS